MKKKTTNKPESSGLTNLLNLEFVNSYNELSSSSVFCGADEVGHTM